ncbi:sugar O-acetyltransferase [Vibrio ostreicida]|uniref:Sugar O-acetyltransferase n=1 Tax=Vibrio ostreicida TaxID=526588 RepID=A0ABT8BZG3_9VIBR|nr:sugar O-acetyltransferase [Vibrio ostreicida]MDN3612557.1 sugar O-acetyltransferase [Vibrio ostreicida]NPD09178.1 sugar O-acetyltransferase [Vibrio ostreicida]
MTEFDRMVQGQVFGDADGTIKMARDKAMQTVHQLNATLCEHERSELFRRFLHSFGSGSKILPPFYCEFGQTLSIGHNTLINMNATLLDGGKITIGDHVLIGPNCQFYTAGHSLDYRQRRQWETTCLPICIEDDVWIGGSVVINQGVTIGARSVIAANSVVIRDVPPDCLYGGTPATLIRHLTDKDT